uniref:Uncharacterized protein n=1 Tax=Leersia perrieri TaxID=77586 RepID=A0A0D9X9T6_9ORYZ
MGRISRLLLVAAAALLVIAAAVTGVTAQEAAVPEEIVVVGKEEDLEAAAALRGELQQLREKISGLESGIAERSQELKVKDDSIANLEKLIEEKSQKIASLQSEITSLQAKGSVAAEEQVGKANARAIDKLKKDVEAQSVNKATLENRANDAEKKLQELNAKIDVLRKANDKQKRKLQNTERALKVAEEELMRVHLEATTKSKQLTEVHGAWLPPWLAAHSARYMEVISGHWSEHGKPAIHTFLQKASEKSAQAKKWAEPHVETAKTKWVPVKEKLVVLKKNTEPYIQKVSSKSVEVYEASRDAVKPHVAKVKEFADPYFQEAKKFSKPYIDQVAEVTKPHVEKVRTTLKPYTKRAVHVYGSFLESATTYHRQAQGTILDYLRQHEASALLAVPVYVIYRLLMGAFCTKKLKRPTHGDLGAESAMVE